MAAYPLSLARAQPADPRAPDPRAVVAWSVCRACAPRAAAPSPYTHLSEETLRMPLARNLARSRPISLDNPPHLAL